MMNRFLLVVAVAALLGCHSCFCRAQGELLLTEGFMTVVLNSVKLSALSYVQPDEEPDEVVEQEILDEFQAGGATLTYFETDPNSAVIMGYQGRCYVAFRGTQSNIPDWLQNFDPFSRDVYSENDPATGNPCEVRRGFVNFLDSENIEAAQARLEECIETECTDPDDCVIISGHSQGGASALVQGILSSFRKPIIITFGQPPTADPGCVWLDPDRIFRFINIKSEDCDPTDLGFDPVPFVPPFISGAEHYGHAYMIGPDPTGLKYLGQSESDSPVSPQFPLDANERSAHSITNEQYGYVRRIEAIFNNNVFPVPADGFPNGAQCEGQYSALCASGTCRDYLCVDASEGDTDGRCGLFGWGWLCLFDSGCGEIERLLGFCGCSTVKRLLGLCAC